MANSSAKAEDALIMRVAIIGAGFSGLSLAYHLLRHNQKAAEQAGGPNNMPPTLFDVQILEARNRVGGRVFPCNLLRHDNTNSSSGETPPVIVDMGGQWIHEASSKNAMVQLLQELKVPLLYKKLQGKAGKKASKQKNGRPPKLSRQLLLKSGTFQADGTPVPKAIFQDIERFYRNVMNRYKSHAVTVHTSFQDLLNEACDSTAPSIYFKRRPASSSSSSPLYKPVLNSLSHRTASFEGGRLCELSVGLDNLYKSYGGNDDIPEGGYHAVLERVADSIGKEKIHLDCPVQSMHYHYDQHIVTIQPRDDGAPTLTADYCICTVPLGVLQNRGIDFHPPLPNDYWKSIDAMGMGLLDKVMMLFEERFWEENLYISVVHEDLTRIQNFKDCSRDYGGAPVLAMLLGG